MASPVTRRRWFGFLVPVLLLGLLAGSGSSSGASTRSDQLTLRLGGGVPDGFHWSGDDDQDPLVQGLESASSSCVVSSPASGPQLVALSATKSSDARGAVIGRNGDALGVKGTSENEGSAGTPCGEIDHRETLTLALGTDLAGKHAVSGQLVLLPRSGPKVEPKVELLAADGVTVVRTVHVGPINTPTTVTIPLGPAFHQVRLGSVTLQDNRAYGLQSGSFLQLANEYSSINCEVGANPIVIPPPSGLIGVDIQILTSVRKAGSTGPCELRYNLETSGSGTGDRRVAFEFPDTGWDLTFRWTTVWTAEAKAYPVPPTKISVDGGTTFSNMVLCDGPATLPVGVDWCLERQAIEAVSPTTMRVTDVAYGQGDPINLR